jgi:hypothetical protein
MDGNSPKLLMVWFAGPLSEEAKSRAKKKWQKCSTFAKIDYFRNLENNHTSNL